MSPNQRICNYFERKNKGRQTEAEFNIATAPSSYAATKCSAEITHSQNRQVQQQVQPQVQVQQQIQPQVQVQPQTQVQAQMQIQQQMQVQTSQKQDQPDDRSRGGIWATKEEAEKLGMNRDKRQIVIVEQLHQECENVFLQLTRAAMGELKQN